MQGVGVRITVIPLIHLKVEFLTTWLFDKKIYTFFYNKTFINGEKEKESNSGKGQNICM
jgi:hypothetical protein